MDEYINPLYEKEDFFWLVAPQKQKVCTESGRDFSQAELRAWDEYIAPLKAVPLKKIATKFYFFLVDCSVNLLTI